MGTTVRAEMPATIISSDAIDRAAEAGRDVVLHTPVTGSAALIFRLVCRVNW